MKSACGADCNECEYGKKVKCKGCKNSNGCPFGKQCFIEKYISVGGNEQYEEFKKELIEEFNSLNIIGMPKLTELYALNGAYVNLSYPLSNGKFVQFLDDNDIYLGNQLECEFNDDNSIRCFGLVANTEFLLVSEYGKNGENPEIIVYKKR